MCVLCFKREASRSSLHLVLELRNCSRVWAQVWRNGLIIYYFKGSGMVRRRKGGEQLKANACITLVPTDMLNTSPRVLTQGRMRAVAMPSCPIRCELLGPVKKKKKSALLLLIPSGGRGNLGLWSASWSTSVLKSSHFQECSKRSKLDVRCLAWVAIKQRSTSSFPGTAQEGHADAVFEGGRASGRPRATHSAECTDSVPPCSRHPFFSVCVCELLLMKLVPLWCCYPQRNLWAGGESPPSGRADAAGDPFKERRHRKVPLFV